MLSWQENRLISSIPQHCMNKWVKLVTNSNSEINVYPTVTQYMGQNFLGASIFSEDYTGIAIGEPCSSFEGEPLIPSRCLNRWVRLAIKHHGGIINIYATKLGPDPRLITGWLWTPDYRTYEPIIC